MKNHILKYPLRAALLFMTAGALLSGCFTDNEKQTPVADIVPLAVGNTWVYVDSVFYRPDSVGTGSTEVNIVGKRSVANGSDSVTVYLLNVKNIFSGNPGPLNVYVRNVGHSNYTYGAEETGASFIDVSQHLRWPAKKGDEYFTHFVGFKTENGNRVPALDTIKVVVVNPDTTCSAPAGTFKCIHYQGYRLDGTLLADTYYAPGIGSLASESSRLILVNDSVRSVRSVKKLVSYTLH